MVESLKKDIYTQYSEANPTKTISFNFNFTYSFTQQ